MNFNCNSWANYLIMYIDCSVLQIVLLPYHCIFSYPWNRLKDYVCLKQWFSNFWSLDPFTPLKVIDNFKKVLFLWGFVSNILLIFIIVDSKPETFLKEENTCTSTHSISHQEWWYHKCSLGKFLSILEREWKWKINNVLVLLWK